jgi:MFS family permease
LKIGGKLLERKTGGRSRYWQVFWLCFAVAAALFLPHCIIDGLNDDFFHYAGDFNDQQISFYSYANNFVKQGGSFSWATDLGSGFVNSYSFYLCGSPFFWLTLLLPYANLVCTIALAVIIGLVISSAFSAILVYATDLMPGKVGMIAGIFFGLMFGLGGLGSAFFGWLADKTSIEFIFRISTLLPLLGIITGFLPNIEGRTTNT